MRRWTAGWLGRGGVDGATGRHGAGGGESEDRAGSGKEWGGLKAAGEGEGVARHGLRGDRAGEDLSWVRGR